MPVATYNDINVSYSDLNVTYNGKYVLAPTTT